MMKKCFLVSLLLATITLMSVNCYAFRCGDEIVSEGDSASAVHSKCGPPTWQETVQVETTGTFGGEMNRRGGFGGQYSEVSEKIEKWYYNCGQFDFVYVLTIRAGQVTKIDTERRGTGKSKCKGAKEED